MNGGPSGFHNAPVTKTIVIATALFTIPFGVRGYSLKLGLAYQDIFEKLRIWRLISSVFAFSSTPELIFGLGLLYYFRVFERQIGSNKYAVFVTFSVLVPLLFEILALGYLKDFLDKLTPGPYSLIFASFVPFFFDIPVSSKFRILTVHLSNKSFIYLAGLQLLFSSGKQSLVPGLCGILAGCFYRFNTFGIRRFKFPDAVTSSLSRVAWPSSSSSSQNLSSDDNVERLPSYPSHQRDVNQLEETVPILPQPSEASLATLISMGFDRNSAMQALLLTRNDLNAATNLLLEAQSH
ncbi:ubiquitin-associated domain-containing protein 2-like isoform X1 [Carex littledalei]|uniref:Ubiquitin-associated domain-containing protein 2-like isoform X1 n=1 Tax=Carex littledalei TaxID=544730 RepID=A0A833R7F6_9POAL|nr:ubiquitin-associated domain-containing protein 2-like isoform X1 [Carex littledalei]